MHERRSGDVKDGDSLAAVGRGDDVVGDGVEERVHDLLLGAFQSGDGFFGAGGAAVGNAPQLQLRVLGTGQQEVLDCFVIFVFFVCCCFRCC